MTNLFTPLVLLALLMLVAAPALAQPAAPEAAQRSASRPQKRLEWPRTFGGQPDFEFEKTEALRQLQTERRQLGQPTPVPASLADVLAAEGLDPLANAVVVSPTAQAEGADVSGSLPFLEAALPSFTPAALPTTEQAVELDLTELETAMVQTALDVVQQYNPLQLAGGAVFDFGYLADFVQVQAIMVSPRASAVLNGTRLLPGETLPITLHLAPPDSALVAAMQALLPRASSPAVQQSYAAAYERAVGALNAQRAANPVAFTTPVQLPLKLLAVAPRAVTVELNGKTYDLPLKTR